MRSAIAFGLQTNSTRDGLQDALRQGKLTIAGANSQMEFLHRCDRISTTALVKVKAWLPDTSMPIL